jgi:hypothetical protein
MKSVGVAAPPEALAPAHAESAHLLQVDQDTGPPWDHWMCIRVSWYTQIYAFYVQS